MLHDSALYKFMIDIDIDIDIDFYKELEVRMRSSIHTRETGYIIVYRNMSSERAAF